MKYPRPPDLGAHQNRPRRKRASGPKPQGPGDEARLEALAALRAATATGHILAVIDGGRS